MECNHCGQKYKFWSAKSGLICDTCWEKYSQTDIEQIVKSLILEEEVIHFGAAYWDTLGSAAGGLVTKAISGALFGGLGLAMTQKEHRAGIIAVTKQELIIVDMDTIVGEVFTNEKLLSLTLKAKIIGPTIKRAPIQELDLSTEKKNPDAIVLKISGPISVKATFPNSVISGNSAKANDIAAFASTYR